MPSFPISLPIPDSSPLHLPYGSSILGSPSFPSAGLIPSRPSLLLLPALLLILTPLMLSSSSNSFAAAAAPPLPLPLSLPFAPHPPPAPQEYIRHRLEEEQRQLEILQQQLLQEQALLLVTGSPSFLWEDLHS